jgi:hypothetical protein
MENHYRHSGTMPLSALFLVLGCSLTAAVPLAAIYACATVYIPILLVNGLITAGVGFGLGYLVFRLSKFGKIRNATVPAVIAGVSALVTLYVAWGCDMLARSGWNEGYIPMKAFSPLVMSQYIAFYYENGMWAFGTSDNLVHGPLLGLIWAGEAFILVGVAAYTAAKQMNSLAFCENCYAWTKLVNDFRRFSIKGAESLLAQVRTGNAGALADAMPPQDNDGSFLRMNLRCCETCSDSNFVDIDEIVIPHDELGKPYRDDRGKTTEEITALISKLEMSAADIERIRDGVPAEQTTAAASGGYSYEDLEPAGPKS